MASDSERAIRGRPRSRRTGRAVLQRLTAIALASALAGPFTIAPHAWAAGTSASEGAGLGKFEQGKKAYEAKDWSGALAAFQASLELLPSPNTRLYIARCFRELGKLASAYTQYDLAAREAKDRIAASGEKRYAATVQAATEESAAIAARVPHLTVTVPEVVPDDLDVQLDGHSLPRSAWGVAVDVDPGAHHVAASGKRLKPFAADVQLAESETRSVAVLVERVPTALLVTTLALQPQGLAISVDGKPVDLATATHGVELDPGVHHVVVRAPGYREFTWDGRVEDGDTKSVPVELAIDTTSASAGGGGTPPWLFYGVAGVAVVTLVGGSVFAFKAKSLSSDEKAKDPLARDPSARDDVRSLSTRANILFIAGGAFAVGAGVLFFTTRWSSSTSETKAAPVAQVTPWIAPTGGGVGWQGSF